MDNGTTSKTSVCVVGLGYIGLPTAAFLADAGLRVSGADVNGDYVQRINAGEVPFREPGFANLLKHVVSNGQLEAFTNPQPADVFIIAVPTPFLDDRSVDITFIESAAQSIAPLLKAGNLVVLESTSPPGTTKRMGEILLAARPDLDIETESPSRIYLAHCPERVLPGKIMEEMVANDRVIGGVDEKSSRVAAELYRNFCHGELLLTDATTAEMAKLTENSFRDVNIAFANELSIICEKLGIDVWELIELANHHPRVDILKPGPGVGGHCIAVDPWFIVSSAPEEARLIRAAREVNDDKPQHVVRLIMEKLNQLPVGERPIVAALGLSFKPNIDDLRESPAVDIVQKLAQDLGDAEILAVEPHVTQLPVSLQHFRNVQLVSIEEAMCKANVAVMLVDHKVFCDYEIPTSFSGPMVDTRGVWR